MRQEPRVILESFAGGSHSRSFRFSGLTEVIEACSTDEVIPALLRVEAAVARGYHAAGFVSYEAAPGINPELAAGPAAPEPLLWFGIFRERRTTVPTDLDSSGNESYETADWTPSLSREAHGTAVNTIRELIAAGDTYQANFTLRQRFGFKGSPEEFYRDLCRSQRAPFCAFIDTGRFQLLSASPELFFELRNGTLTTRPMKGTSSRGRWYAEDEEFKRRLRGSEKERAENLMIVDLLRNDLGMVARTGTVETLSLFDIETLETLHQMTSTVTATPRDGVTLVELFQALFPCGSVTGAPKKRTMEIIRDLEDSPRGAYTGCIGHVSPGSGTEPFETVFSVAIRTVVIDSLSGTGVLGIGSGITWDSGTSSEYDECLAKSRFARERIPPFQLIETLLFTAGTGYFLLERHLARLARSAAFFGFSIPLGSIKEVLDLRTRSLQERHKVRLILSRSGAFSVQTEPLAEDEKEAPRPIAFAAEPVDSHNPFLFHKTTNRQLYRDELSRHPGCLDVVFCNERREVTEGGNHNIVALINGSLVTPPLACGLLPGTFREELLAGAVIREQVITREELERAEHLYLINSVRRWRQAFLA